ncbi:Na+/H+ antiporter family protein [Helicobacter winghamensis]|uniref:Sodium:proton antiporter n=1 Tax=Helicobacter winghamensis TaxID=157268 RepID=A0A2N3PJX4_9HELI|nr:SLC13 family permease [Helicobacter winghamensis]EEO26334.1 Na+/H+ antiporter family protein [Helicobacter winghamensis ATCC BAA-430]PKT77319.1 sodium:proton antiporter [Helicobacter winghamensis]PKT77520.1 sodium:proton antiporter [Helicobacter winghamensis]PKT77748.1 sodium:proton antiporter [Helicobacter winghamensis]PKT81485.1 sodium:proton antiporter [Helicobacter winghamensis]
MLTNPVVVSILVMGALCLARLNVLLAILISALVAGVLGGLGIEKSISLLISGMAGNLETALSYILLGALASAIAQTNLTMILIHYIAKFVQNRRLMFCLSLAFFACFSQNLIPVHIAFIPILIPPLLPLMNRLKIDRRAVACALTFGLKAPYVSFGAGFGLIFHTILRDQLNQNGVRVNLDDIASVMWIGGACMLLGLLFGIFVFYRKPREYQNTYLSQETMESLEKPKICQKDIAVLLGAVVAFVVQLWLKSLPLGGLCGLIVMIILGGIKWNEIDSVMEDGFKMMAFIAFVMLVAAGFGAVLKETGAITTLVDYVATFSNGKMLSAFMMLLVGLFITLGIGTSFGTIPIIAAIYCPLALTLGFSPAAIILLVGIAGALGDAGSPASDSTLGPTAGLNMDKQHNHIWDTCVPTFLMYNIPLIIGGTIGAILL